MMNPELKAQWVAALRSGEYKQARGFLRKEEANGDASYCCLGVLCEIQGIPRGRYETNSAWVYEQPWEAERQMPSSTNINSWWAHQMGINHETVTLMHMNDGGMDDSNGEPKDYSFTEIADYIEKHL